MITLTGKKISEGIAIGRLAFYKRGAREVRRIYVEDVRKELARFQKACEKAAVELQDLYMAMTKEIGEVNASMFEMHQMVLNDTEFIDSITGIIKEERLNADYAVKEASKRFIEKYASRDASYVRGHEADVRDVAARLLRLLARIRKDSFYWYQNVIKTEYEGKMVVIDGFEGRVYIEPDQTTLARMQEKKRTALRKVETLERLKGKENVTQSGQKIDVCANIGAKEEIESVLRNDSNGIGLFRSEFIYMESGMRFPTEEQQFQIYKLAAESMGAKRVVIRTADLGGEKSADCLEITGENNPIMGYRGIRVSLDKEEMFKIQLRAILRASAFGNIAVMFPMISSMEEVLAAKDVLEKVKQDLRNEKTLLMRQSRRAL